MERTEKAFGKTARGRLGLMGYKDLNEIKLSVQVSDKVDLKTIIIFGIKIK